MPKTPDYFQGKTLFLTGAASGIGQATAYIFAREGANVICADVDAEGAARVAKEVDQRGGKGFAVDCDVTKRADVEKAVADGIAHFGRIDFQFNNAGSAIKRSKFLDIDDDLFEKTYDLNVKGVFYGMQAIVPHMLENGGGVIVNTASMAAVRGGGGHSIHYASAKGAVVTMTMGVAREFVKQNIRCVSVSPAAADTNFQNISSNDLKQSMTSDIPIGRMAEPEEIAEVVLFLCSDAASYITADTIKISGGGGYR
jgi:NAD(P)-dependent dehydrogenase (short-subunit alcohol dehydrogenase family)